MNTAELLKGRRSIRKYQEKLVEHDVLREVVELASYAPSWKNTQITRYIAIENQDIKNYIVNECVGEHNAEIITSAPVLVVVTAIKNRCGFERDGSYTTKKEDRWQNFDCGIASYAFSLAAHEKGLGTVIMGIFDEDKIREKLDIPEEREVMALIAVGYAAEEPTAPKRKTVDDLLEIR